MGKTENVKFVGILLYALLIVAVLLDFWGAYLISITLPSQTQLLLARLQLLTYIHLIEFLIIIGLLGMLLSRMNK